MITGLKVLDFPGCSVVKTPCSHCTGTGLILGWGSSTCCTVWLKNNTHTHTHTHTHIYIYEVQGIGKTDGDRNQNNGFVVWGGVFSLERGKKKLSGELKKYSILQSG